MVLTGRDGTRQLCIAGTTDEGRPACLDPAVTITDWPGGDGSHVDGEYRLTGHFDGRTLSVSSARRADASGEDPGPSAGDDDATPCHVPAGGWRVVDQSKARPSDLDNLDIAVTNKVSGVRSVWIDFSRNPAPDTESTPLSMANDPRYATVNVLVAGDVARATRAVRKLWGGALCVVKAGHGTHRAEQIRDELTMLPGFVQEDDGRDTETLDVIHDDGSLQRWADARYGHGYVRIRPLLVPASD